MTAPLETMSEENFICLLWLVNLLAFCIILVFARTTDRVNGWTIIVCPILSIALWLAAGANLHGQP